MRKNPVMTKAPGEQVMKDIRRATRKLHSSEEKIRIVLSGLRGEDGIAELSPRELAVKFADTEKYFASEASVYHLLKSHDLIISPAYIVIKGES